MGCLKIIEYQELTRIRKNHFFLGDAYEKNISSSKKRTDYYPFGGVLANWESSNNDKYRHGYQGLYAEKDDETGFNHFEAREYDSRIGRWTVTDPARQFYSPYNGMGNNPISGLDPDGRDVILLNAPNGAGGYGHVGMLVGSAGNWRYISKEGTASSSGMLGPGNDVTNDVALQPPFNSLQGFLNSEFNKSGRYHSGILIVTDEATDASIIEQGVAGLSTTYDVLGSNCLQNCTRPLGNQGVIPSYLRSEFLPNKTYWKIFDLEFNNGFDFTNFKNFNSWSNFTLFHRENYLPQGTIEVEDIQNMGKID